MTPDSKERADIVALPPFILLAGIVAGFGIDAIFPVDLLPVDAQIWVGACVIVLSIAVMPFVLRLFRRHETSFDGRKPTDAIIKTGPYRLSRNPAYVASYLLQIGLAVIADNVWLLATLVVTVVITHYGVVRREEAYLERKFGDEYRAYAATVRRYI